MANNVKFGQSGFKARETRRLYIVNGSDLVTGKKQQAFLPLAEGAEGILSGQPVNRQWGEDAQEFAVPTNKTADSIYFANADAIDHDVVACGKLPAIYSGDDFEIQTPFFDAAQDYNPGDKLYLAVVDGKVVVTSLKTNALQNSNNEVVVVGIVSKGKINLGSINQGLVSIPLDADGNSTNDVVGGPRVWVNDTESTSVLQFYTKALTEAAN